MRLLSWLSQRRYSPQRWRAWRWLGAGLLAAVGLVALGAWMVSQTNHPLQQPMQQPLASLRQWEQQLHQQLRQSGARATATVQQSADKQRVLAEDEALATAVADALAAAQSDDLRQLQVDTHRAMVTLSGAVATADLRMRAVAIAHGVAGVQGVFSVIQVAPQ